MPSLKRHGLFFAHTGGGGEMPLFKAAVIQAYASLKNKIGTLGVCAFFTNTTNYREIFLIWRETSEVFSTRENENI